MGHSHRHPWLRLKTVVVGVGGHPQGGLEVWAGSLAPGDLVVGGGVRLIGVLAMAPVRVRLRYLYIGVVRLMSSVCIGTVLWLLFPDSVLAPSKTFQRALSVSPRRCPSRSGRLLQNDVRSTNDDL